jgi:hypothetical protein
MRRSDATGIGNPNQLAGPGNGQPQPKSISENVAEDEKAALKAAFSSSAYETVQLDW